MALMSALKQLCNNLVIDRNDEERLSVLVHDKDAKELYRHGNFRLTFTELKLIRDSCTTTPSCKLFRAEVQNTQVLFLVNGSGELVGTGEFNVESRDNETNSRDLDAGYESCTSIKDDDDDVGDNDVGQIAWLKEKIETDSSDYKQGRYNSEKGGDGKGSHSKTRPSFKSGRKLTIAACSMSHYTVVVCIQGEGHSKGSALGRVKDIRNVLQSLSECGKSTP